MNLAKNFENYNNPIDTIESILHSRSYQLERRGSNEVVVEVEGKFSDMLLFFSWEENLQCLHISCIINLEHKEVDNSKIFELLALINDNIWVGHFSYWSEEKLPVYRHSLFSSQDNENFFNHFIQATDIAINECQKMYPIFNAVLNKGISPQQALIPMMIETFGQA